jgi:hypothetical protein
MIRKGNKYAGARTSIHITRSSANGQSLTLAKANKRGNERWTQDNKHSASCLGLFDFKITGNLEQNRHNCQTASDDGISLRLYNPTIVLRDLGALALIQIRGTDYD